MGGRGRSLRDDENYRLRDMDVHVGRRRRGETGRTEFFSHLLMTAADAPPMGYPFTVNNNHSITARDVHVIRCLP